MLFCVPSLLFASLLDNLEELRFSSITQNNGLPHNHVECIIKDSDGFVWFGTRNGLSRFDGYEIKTYYSESDPNSLSGNRILSISEDLHGNLWIGTYNNGVNKFNKRTETFTRYSAEQGIGNWVDMIKVFSDSIVWVCSDWGLAKYDAERDTFQVWRGDDNDSLSIGANAVYDILRTQRGEYFVAAEVPYIQKMDVASGKFTPVIYERSPLLKTNYRKRLVEAKDGSIWICANNHGLSKYNPITKESKFYDKGSEGIAGNTFSGSMAFDSEDNLWLASDGGGINIFSTKTETFEFLVSADREGALASNNVYSIYIDDNNIIWVGTFDKGINYFDPEQYKFVTSLYTPNDLSFFEGMSVISTFQDSKGNIWIGTDGHGLYMIDKTGKIKTYKSDLNKANTLSTDVITCIDEDADGNILLGTYTGGLMSLNANSGKFNYYQQSTTTPFHLGSANVWDILTDSKGRIWLGLLGGGYDQFDPVEQKFYNHGPGSNTPQMINFPNVMVVYEDSEGDVWFGTEGRGLYVLDNQTDKMEQLPVDSTQNVTTQGLIKCIYEDKWGQIWIGTEGDGLYVYDRKKNTYTNFNLKAGLPSNIITGFTEDDNGNIWIASSKGLAVYSAENKTFRCYYESDGLSSSSFNQGAIMRLADGRILAGTANGLDLFSPERITANVIIPPVAITSISILNQTIEVGKKYNDRVVLENDINYTKSIALMHKEKAFSIEFAALNYTLPEKVLYKYKLDGFDEDWIQISAKNRTISYTNLPPGEYMLKIMASNNDALWGNNVRELQIQVLPPFYLTFWFKAIAALITLLIVFVAYRYRLNSIRNRYLQKEFDQEKRILDLEKEKLDAELQKLTFHVLNRNRELINQKNRLMGLSMKAKESVRLGLQDIIAKFDEELNDDKDWKYIEPQLDKVYNNFVSRLKEKHQSLSVSEIKIAAYVRMDLSTKDIAEFMHKTPRAIENDRYRLRKKLELGTNDSLKEYLNNL